MDIKEIKKLKVGEVLTNVNIKSILLIMLVV